MYNLRFIRYTVTAVSWTTVELSFASRQRQVAFFFRCARKIAKSYY